MVRSDIKAKDVAALVYFFTHYSPVPGELVNSDGWPSGRLPSADSVVGHSAPAGGVQWPGQPW